MLKLQSALEYLTTYGWAILIIAVALVTLFELGIFTPKPDTQCIIEAGFSCSGYTLNSQGVLAFTLNQQTSHPVNITGIACYENGTLLAGQAPYNPPSNQVFMPVGSSTTFYVQCFSSQNNEFSGNLGSYFHGSIAIYYKDAITHLTELAVGSLILPVTTTQQILTNGNPSNLNTVAIKLIDTTSQPVYQGFQQEIVINPSSYAQYGLNANLSNLEFTTGEYGSGSPIYSWIESGASNTATSAVIWLKLPAGITSNGGTQIIYMNFFANKNPVLSGYTGYAPQLYCSSGCFQTSYAQYDNGGDVFNFYDNFAGTTLNANKWQDYTNCGGDNVNVDNQISLGPYNSIITSQSFGDGNVIDMYALITRGAVSESCFFGGIAIDPSYETGAATAITGYGSTQYPNTPYSFDFPTQPSSSEYHVWSLIIPTNGLLSSEYDYSNLISGTTYLTSPAQIWLVSQSGSGVTVTADWVRTRVYPPDGQMPSVDILGLIS
jgi:hypothetical protein